MVVVNKVDRADARPDEVHTEMFDLFATLGATEEQLDFPMLYASGRQGWADPVLDGPRRDLSALFDLILRHVPPTRTGRGGALRPDGDDPGMRPLPGPHLTGRIERGWRASTCR